MIKNRLELFKKRQREDADKMKAELVAPVAPAVPFGGDMQADIPESAEDNEQEAIHIDEYEFAEEYSREMSPPLLDPGRVPSDDRKLPIVQEEDDMRDLVSQVSDCISQSVQCEESSAVRHLHCEKCTNE